MKDRHKGDCEDIINLIGWVLVLQGIGGGLGLLTVYLLN